jgi:hypothetical protein
VQNHGLAWRPSRAGASTSRLVLPCGIFTHGKNTDTNQALDAEPRALLTILSTVCVQNCELCHFWCAKLLSGAQNRPPGGYLPARKGDCPIFAHRGNIDIYQ